MIYFLVIVLCFKMDLGIFKYYKFHLKTKILFSNFENDIMNFKSTFWIWIIQNDTKIEIIKKNTFIFLLTLRKY